MFLKSEHHWAFDHNVAFMALELYYSPITPSVCNFLGVQQMFKVTDIYQV